MRTPSPRRRTSAEPASSWVRPQRRTEVLLLTDLSQRTFSATQLLDLPRDRRPNSEAARGAAEFLSLNRERLSALDVSGSVVYDRDEPAIQLSAATTLGAVPLLSPLTGRSDVGLVVEPRFGWLGIGPALATTGWRVVPTILNMPVLPTSARNIPNWVLSTTVLARIQRLLEVLRRRFELTEAHLHAPRGRVLWGQYAYSSVARGRLDRVPRKFPELQCDRDLLGAIHWTLRRQLAGLEGERGCGSVVLEILEWCRDLLLQVSSVEPRFPHPRELDAWLHFPLTGPRMREGVEAIAWTVEERGLAGVSDLRGLPWRMSMEAFWEAWVETVAEAMMRSRGGSLRTGWRSATTVPIAWEPPFLGSQRSLVPDLVWLRPDHAVVFDAKYKQHWTELQRTQWSDLDEVTRAHHREDILQVLAYANLVETPAVSLVLAYPCFREAYLRYSSEGRSIYIATIPGPRRLRVALTGIPLAPELLPRVAEQLMHALDQT